MTNFLLSLLIMTSIIASNSQQALKNPITKQALLILLFLTVSSIFQILDFNFLGLTYIIVYVGAIAILFLFVIMLVQTNKSQDPKENDRPIQEVENEIIGNINNSSKNKKLNLIDLIILDSEKDINNSLIGGLNKLRLKNKLKFRNNKQILILSQLIGGYIGYENKISLLELNSSKQSSKQSEEIDQYSYFIPAWSTDIQTLTDISVLGYSLYLGYPIGVLLLGVLLWIVLIGILCISYRNC